MEQESDREDENELMAKRIKREETVTKQKSRDYGQCKSYSNSLTNASKFSLKRKKVILVQYLD